MKSPLYQYDRAVFDLIHSLYDEVYFCSPEEVLSKNARKHSGKVLIPFISVWRLPDFSINTEMENDSFLRRGYLFRSTEGRIEHPNQKVAMHGLPVTLSYNIDIYATKRDVCDGITAELMMYLREHPYVVVQLMDAGERLQEFNFDLEESVTDNTDISDFLEGGRLYRLSLTANITEAVIYRVDDFNKVEKILIDFKGTSKDTSLDVKDTDSDAKDSEGNRKPTKDVLDGRIDDFNSEKSGDGLYLHVDKETGKVTERYDGESEDVIFGG